MLVNKPKQNSIQNSHCYYVIYTEMTD